MVSRQNFFYANHGYRATGPPRHICWSSCGSLCMYICFYGTASGYWRSMRWRQTGLVRSFRRFMPTFIRRLSPSFRRLNTPCSYTSVGQYLRLWFYTRRCSVCLVISRGTEHRQSVNFLCRHFNAMFARVDKLNDELLCGGCVPGVKCKWLSYCPILSSLALLESRMIFHFWC